MEIIYIVFCILYLKTVIESQSWGGSKDLNWTAPDVVHPRPVICAGIDSTIHELIYKKNPIQFFFLEKNDFEILIFEILEFHHCFFERRNTYASQKNNGKSEKNQKNRKSKILNQDFSKLREDFFIKI